MNVGWMAATKNARWRRHKPRLATGMLRILLLKLGIALALVACDEATPPASAPIAAPPTTAPETPKPPQVSGRWEVVDDGGMNAFALVQNDGDVVFSTRSRDLGDFHGSLTAEGVEAPDKGLTATLSEDEQTLTWSNGMVWGRIAAAQFGGRPWQR